MFRTDFTLSYTIPVLEEKDAVLRVFQLTSIIENTVLTTLYFWRKKTRSSAYADKPARRA